jgi:hypothetical protein
VSVLEEMLDLELDVELPKALPVVRVVPAASSAPAPLPLVTVPVAQYQSARSLSASTPPPPVSVVHRIMQQIVDDADKIFDFSASNLPLSQQLFLVSFMRYGTISKACADNNIGVRTVHKWIEDPECEFAICLRTAQEMIADAVEGEGLRLALHGTELAKTRLIPELLQGLKPERYAKKKHEISGPKGGPIQVETWAGIAQMCYDEERKKIAATNP